MSQNIIIVGAGGFGREVQWLIERINKDKTEKKWKLIGYVDDGMQIGTDVNGVPVLGGIDYLQKLKEPVNAVCAIGNAEIRKKVIQKLTENERIDFPNLIDPSVQLSEKIKMGRGNIICAGTILTVDIVLQDFIILNLDCTVGHDVRLDSYVTVYPSVNISGNVTVGEACELGTGAQIIQGKALKEKTIVGAGAVVIDDLPGYCTAVGIPAVVVKQK